MSNPKTPFVFYRGWAETEGRKLTLGRPDPRTLYVPRVDGVMPELVGTDKPTEPEEDDDHRVPVDVMLKRRGIQ